MSKSRLTHTGFGLGFRLDKGFLLENNNWKTIGLKVVFLESKAKFLKKNHETFCPCFNRSPALQSFVVNASLLASKGVSEILKAIRRFYVTLSNGFMNTRRWTRGKKFVISINIQFVVQKGPSLYRILWRMASRKKNNPQRWHKKIKSNTLLS